MDTLKALILAAVILAPAYVHGFFGNPMNPANPMNMINPASPWYYVYNSDTGQEEAVQNPCLECHHP